MKTKTALGIATSFWIILALFSCGSGSASSWEIVKQLTTRLTPAGHGETSAYIPLVNFLNEDIGAGINFGNYYFYTDDGGKNWRETKIAANPCLRLPEIVDADTILIGCPCSYTKFSGDAGLTWENTDLSTLPLISMVDKNTGFFGSTGKLVAVKLDADEALDVRTPGKTGNVIIALSAVSATGIFVLSQDGTLFYSANAGQSWEEKVVPVMENREIMFKNQFTTMRFKNEKEGLIVSFDKKAEEWVVLATKDGCKKWSNEAALKDNLGYSAVSRNLDYITITPISGDIGILVLRKK